MTAKTPHKEDFMHKKVNMMNIIKKYSFFMQKSIDKKASHDYSY